jgi:amino acid adenylation domain-containing protein
MVAIQMAGGALVPLDPAAPLARLQSIVSDTQAQLIVTHPSLEDKLQELGVDLLIIDNSVLHQLPDAETQFITSGATPDSLYAVLFTSGSTGKPKGIRIPHSSLCSASDAHAASTGVGPGARVFQFSAYTFDVGVLDVLITLMRGGCVCVPSEHDRLHNIAGAINALRANWALLTPSVADMINPADVPGLTTLGMIGEAIYKKNSERWKGYAELHGLYGPAEASVCAWNSDIHNGPSTNLGYPLSSAFWVVEADDPSRLVPIGCIGELLIQSPILACGYLNADAKNTANWLEDMTYNWLPANGPKRAYRTGDMVRRNPDKTFEYMGRKDNQVKIRGQRVELSEIEYVVFENLPGLKQIVVDMINNQEAGLSLVTYMCFSDDTRGSSGDLDGMFLSITPEMKQQFSEMLSQLSIYLPHYMIPTIFVPCSFMPLNTSGKMDRKAFRACAAALSKEELVAA